MSASLYIYSNDDGEPLEPPSESDNDHDFIIWNDSVFGGVLSRLDVWIHNLGDLRLSNSLDQPSNCWHYVDPIRWCMCARKLEHGIKCKEAWALRLARLYRDNRGCVLPNEKLAFDLADISNRLQWVCDQGIFSVALVVGV